MPKDNEAVNEQPKKENQPGMTILDVNEGNGYGNYALFHTIEKGLYNYYILGDMLDKKENTTTHLKKMGELTLELEANSPVEEHSFPHEKFFNDPTKPELRRAVSQNVDEMNRKASAFFKEATGEYRKFLEEHKDDPNFTHFKSMWDINMLPMDFEKGNFSQAVAESPYLLSLYSQSGALPKFDQYSLEELKKELGGQDGKQPPLTLMDDYYKGINGLFDLEYEKQKLMKTNPGQEEKKAYLNKLKDGMQNMVNAYDNLYSYVEKHPKDNKKEFLNNQLDHLTGVSNEETRDPSRAIGQMRGQIKAIENGWDLDELTPIGNFGALKAAVETDIRKADYRIALVKNDFEKEEAKYQQKNDGSPKPAYLKELEQKYKDAVESKEQNQKLLADLNQFEKNVLDQKVSNAWDKREMLDSIDQFHNKCYKDYPLTKAKFILSEQSDKLNKETYQKVVDDLYAKDFPEQWKQKGIPEEMGETRVELNNVVDIFGPNARHHAIWEDGVIPKKTFEEKLKPYDSSKLHFSDTELAYLGMAYASLDKPDTIKALKDWRPNYDPKGMLSQNAFWTTDLFKTKEKPRDNVASFSGVVSNAREGAKKAAEDYVAGDKKAVAEIIHRGLSLQAMHAHSAGSAGRETTMCDYGRTKSFLGMLDRDPELMQEFQKINEKAPAAEKVDLEQQRGYLNYLRVTIDKLSAEDEIKRNPSMSKERREELDRQILKGKMLDALQMADSNLGRIDPEYLRKDNAFQAQYGHLSKKNETLGEYTMRATEFMDKNKPESEAQKLFRSEQGIQKFNEFIERMEKQYGQGGKSYNEMRAASNNRLDTEISKFLVDQKKEMILDRLSREPAPTEKEMKELTAAYIQNDTASRKYEEYLNGGELDSLAKSLGNGYQNEAHVKDYNQKLQDLVDNMDFHNMQPDELKNLLTSDTAKEEAEKLYNAANLKRMQDKEEYGPFMGDAVAALKDGNKGTWFGKADYDKVIKDLDSLNQMYEKNRKAFLKDGSSAIAPDLAKKQEELLKGMDAYMRRKEEEFERNKVAGKKDNENSKRRYDAMKKAKQDLQARIAYDRKFDQMMVDAAEYQEGMRNAAEMSVQNGYEIKVPDAPGVKNLSAKAAKAGLNKLTRIAKEGVQNTPEMRSNVRTAMASVVLNEMVTGSEKVENSMPNVAAEYASQVRKLASSPEFDKCLPIVLTNRNLREFLADADGPKKMLDQFKANVKQEQQRRMEAAKKEEHQQMEKTKKELTETKESANRKRSNSISGKPKTKTENQPDRKSALEV